MGELLGITTHHTGAGDGTGGPFESTSPVVPCSVSGLTRLQSHWRFSSRVGGPHPVERAILFAKPGRGGPGQHRDLHDIAA